MTPFPKLPVGNDPIVQCVRLLIACIRERTPLPDPSVRLHLGPNGFTINAAVEAAPAKQTTSSGMIFRGEWDAGTSYQPGDVVIVRNGQSSGTYICVAATGPGDLPPQYPLTGEKWINLSPGNILGNWL